MTWRAIYKANVLKEKYGVLGKVASRYLLAGFDVRIRDDLIYVRGKGVNEVLGVIVSERDVDRVLNKLKEIKDKVGLSVTAVFYGNKKWGDEVTSKFKDQGIKVRFIRGDQDFR
ncbi:MAG: hypothetical protein DRO18_00115 [Thermoprotei archaeon]|nr:MAG: hypothetical protein DRO18_00115 [Thermoprotei archaeon]